MTNNCRAKLLLVIATFWMHARPSIAQEVPSFSRDVLPILSDKCFVCHGPDAASDAALRLDTFEGATADLGGYSAIDADSPESSNLLERIHSTDDPMPPADADKQLNDEEREILSRWIKAGGKYETHWAFVPPKRPALPPGDESNPIDRFVAAQLASAGIDFAPPADDETLGRRMALTLTGLPLSDNDKRKLDAGDSGEKFQKLITRLFASPRYGEHQARYWLDAVRYGDTHGLHLDNRRGIFVYRDWIVRAFNQNLPFDDFLTWQIAGDLLPSPSLQQKVATGFVRMNPSTGEGGAIAEEFQAKNSFDRTETFGTVLLGMSLTCARCHTHKYDPITQQEYYSLLAFFNNTAEPALDRNSYTYGDSIKAPEDQAAWDRWETLEQKRDQLLSGSREVLEKVAPAALKASAQERARDAWVWRRSATLPVDAPEPAEGDWVESPDLAKDLRELKLPKGESIWLEGRVELSSDTTLWLNLKTGAAVQMSIDGIDTPVPSNYQSGDEYSGVPLNMAAGSHTLRVQLVGLDGKTPLALTVANPWKSLSTHGIWDHLTSSEQLRLLADHSKHLAQYWIEAESTFGSSRLSAESILRMSQQLERTAATTLVARELPNPRETRLLRRGEYHLPQGDPVQPDVPSIMGKLADSLPRNRLGLAKWLTAADHPLVSRVLVNRIWQRVFGAGLVRTPEDFGVQGQHPTHPELLDWLAVEFQESGWDVQHMLRLMLSSRTFAQSSRYRPEINDPENRLYARGPYYRLDAEVIRDIGLWASGLLDDKMGGEGVKPYQPAGMWAALAHPASNTKKYERDKGTPIYRRSLYVYWKRTSPHPMMTLFDAPDRESSCVRRSRTDTPLQSLGLFNETLRVEMARCWANELLKNYETDEERIDALIEKVACRKPLPEEKEVCRMLLAEAQREFSQSPERAAQLLNIGDAAVAAKLSKTEVAAWTQVCSAVLASDLAIVLY